MEITSILGFLGLSLDNIGHGSVRIVKKRGLEKVFFDPT